MINNKPLCNITISQRTSNFEERNSTIGFFEVRTLFNEAELKVLKRSLTGFHLDRVIMGESKQAELIRRLIQEIDKQEGSKDDH